MYLHPERGLLRATSLHQIYVFFWSCIWGIFIGSILYLCLFWKYIYRQQGQSCLVTFTLVLRGPSIIISMFVQCILNTSCPRGHYKYKHISATVLCFKIIIVMLLLQQALSNFYKADLCYVMFCTSK